MSEEKWMIVLGVWANIVATIALVETVRKNKKKTAPKTPHKQKRKR